MADTFKKKVQIEIEVTGSLGEIFGKFGRNFQNSAQILTTIQQSLESVRETVEQASQYTDTLAQHLLLLKLPDTFTDDLARLRGLGSIRVPDLDKFTNGLSALQILQNIPSPQHIQKIATALKPLNGMTVPSLEGFAKGLAIMKEIDADQLTKIAIGLEEMGKGVQGLAGAKMPELEQFAKGVAILADPKLDVGKLGMKFSTLATGLSHFKGMNNLPQLGQFAKGVNLLADTTVNAKVTKLPLKFKSLADSIKQFKGMTMPQLGQFAAGIQRITEINSAKVQAVATRLGFLDEVLSKYKDLKVPQLSQFAKGISVIASIEDDGLASVSKNLNELHVVIKQYNGLKVPQLSQFAKGVTELSKVGSMGTVASDLKKLITPLKKFDRIKIPDFHSFAAGVKVLAGVRITDGFATKLSKIGTALKELPSDIQQFPSLKGFAEGIAVLNNVKLDADLTTKLGSIGTALKKFPKKLAVPNLVGLADGLRILKELTITKKLTSNLSSIATALEAFKGIRVPSLAGVATGIEAITKMTIKPALGENLRKLKDALAGFNKDIKIPSLKSFAAGIKDLADIKGFNEALPEVFRKLALALKEFDTVKSIPSIGGMAAGLEKLKKLDMDAVAGQLAKLSKAIEQLEKAGKLHVFARFAKDLQGVAKLTTDTTQKLKGGRNAIAKWGYAVTSASAGLTQFNGRLYGLARGLSSINAGLATLTGFSASFAAVFAVKGAVRELAEFDDSLRAAGATAQATIPELQELEMVTRELGATTRYTSSQVAEALRQLSMAGFSVEESMVALPQVLKLATAGMMDIGRAADITTNVLRGYAMEVTDLGRINDVLVAAFTNSSTNLEQLGTAFQYVGPLAAAANIEFEETAALLSGLAQAGYHSSKAGMSLRNAITRLLEPTKRVQESLNMLGVTVKDSSGQMYSMINIIEQFRSAGATVSDIITIFGKRAGPGIAALINQPADSLRNFLDIMHDAKGTANQVATDMEAGMGGALRQLKSAWQEMSIEFGRQIEPTVLIFLRELTQLIRDNKSQVAEWATSMLDIVIVLGKVVAELGAIIVNNKLVLQALTVGIAGTMILSKLMAFGVAVKATQAATAALATEVAAAEVTTTAWGSSLAFLKARAAGASAALVPLGLMAKSLGWIGAAAAAVVGIMHLYTMAVRTNTKALYNNVLKQESQNKALNDTIDTLEDLRDVFSNSTEGSDEWIEAERELAQVVPAATLALDEQGTVIAKMGKGFEDNGEALDALIAKNRELAKLGAAASIAKVGRAWAASVEGQEKASENIQYYVNQVNALSKSASAEKIRAFGDALQSAFDVGPVDNSAKTDAANESLKGHQEALKESLTMQGKVETLMRNMVKAFNDGKTTADDFNEVLSKIDLPDNIKDKFRQFFADELYATRDATTAMIDGINQRVEEWRAELASGAEGMFLTDEDTKFALTSLDSYVGAMKNLNGQVLADISARRMALIEEHDESTRIFNERMAQIEALRAQGELTPGAENSYTSAEADKEEFEARLQYALREQQLNKQMVNVQLDHINSIADADERYAAHKSYNTEKSLAFQKRVYKEEEARIEKLYGDEIKFAEDKSRALVALAARTSINLRAIEATGGADANQVVKDDTTFIDENKLRYEAYYNQLREMATQEGADVKEIEEQISMAVQEELEFQVRLRTNTYNALVKEHGKYSTKIKAAEKELSKAVAKASTTSLTHLKAEQKKKEKALKDELKALKLSYTNANKVAKEQQSASILALEEHAAATVNVEENLALEKLEIQLDTAEKQYQNALAHQLKMQKVSYAGSDKERAAADLEVDKKRNAAHKAYIAVQVQGNKELISKREQYIKNATKLEASLTRNVKTLLTKRNNDVDKLIQQGIITAKEGEQQKRKNLVDSLNQQLKIANDAIEDFQDIEYFDQDVLLAKLEARNALVLQVEQAHTAELAGEQAIRVDNLKKAYDQEMYVIEGAYSDRAAAIKLLESDNSPSLDAQTAKIASMEKYYADIVALHEKNKKELEKENLLDPNKTREISNTILNIHRKHYGAVVDMIVASRGVIQSNADKIVSIHEKMTASRNALDQQGMTVAEKFYDNRRLAEEELAKAAEDRARADNALGAEKARYLEMSNAHLEKAASLTDKLTLGTQKGIVTDEVKAQKLALMRRVEEQSVSNVEAVSSAREAELKLLTEQAGKVLKLKEGIQAVRDAVVEPAIIQCHLATDKVLSEADDLKKRVTEAIGSVSMPVELDSVKGVNKELIAVKKTAEGISTQWKKGWTEGVEEAITELDTLSEVLVGMADSLMFNPVRVEFDMVASDGNNTAPIATKLNELKTLFDSTEYTPVLAVDAKDSTTEAKALNTLLEATEVLAKESRKEVQKLLQPLKDLIKALTEIYDLRDLILELKLVYSKTALSDIHKFTVDWLKLHSKKISLKVELIGDKAKESVAEIVASSASVAAPAQENVKTVTEQIYDTAGEEAKKKAIDDTNKSYEERLTIQRQLVQDEAGNTLQPGPISIPEGPASPSSPVVTSEAAEVSRQANEDAIRAQEALTQKRLDDIKVVAEEDKKYKLEVASIQASVDLDQKAADDAKIETDLLEIELLNTRIKRYTELNNEELRLSSPDNPSVIAHGKELEAMLLKRAVLLTDINKIKLEAGLAEEEALNRQEELLLSVNEMSIALGNYGSDTERTEAIYNAHVLTSEKIIENKENELEKLQLLGSQFADKVLEKQNEIDALVKQTYADEIAYRKEIAAEKLAIIETEWSRGIASAEDYRKAVQEAYDLNLMSAQEYYDKMASLSVKFHEKWDGAWEQSKGNLKTQFDHMADLAGTVQTAMVDGFADTFMEVIDGTKSFADAFSDMAIQIIKDITKILLKMALTNLFFGGGGNAFSFGGKAEGGLIQQLATGGPVVQRGVQQVQKLATGGGVIQGYSPSSTADNIPIWATADEFMQPVKAVKHYGLQFMESIRTMRFPKVLASSIAPLVNVSGLPTGGDKTHFAEGGKISGSGDTSYAISVPVNVSGVENPERMAASMQMEVEQVVMDVLRRELA